MLCSSCPYLCLISLPEMVEVKTRTCSDFFVRTFDTGRKRDKERKREKKRKRERENERESSLISCFPHLFIYLCCLSLKIFPFSHPLNYNANRGSHRWMGVTILHRMGVPMLINIEPFIFTKMKYQVSIYKCPSSSVQKHLFLQRLIFLKCLSGRTRSLPLSLSTNNFPLSQTFFSFSP